MSLVNSVFQLVTSKKVLHIFKLVNKMIDISLVICKLFLTLVIWVISENITKLN